MRTLLFSTALASLAISSPAVAQSVQAQVAPNVWSALQLCQVDQLYHFKTDTCPVPAPPPSPPPVNPPLAPMSQCAQEGGICQIAGTGLVRYGLEPNWVTKTVTDSIGCNNTAFAKDPIFGKAKVCQTDHPLASGASPSIPVATPAPAPSQTPTPTPTSPPVQAAGWVPADTPLVGATFIDDTDVTVSAGRATSALPPTNAPDDVGAFRFVCAPGQILADDPILKPGVPGGSHIHQFYGNTSADANSNYSSLRHAGKSTCSGPVDALNRSAYWLPALLDGKGNVRRPNFITVYYKRFPKADPHCAPPYSTGCVAVPNGLRMISGRNLLNLAQVSFPNRPVGKYGFHFNCTKASGAVAHDAQGKTDWDTLAPALAVCPADGTGWQLTLNLDFFDCWDGVNIDSPDHRSHVGYSINGYCPIFSQTGQRGVFMPILMLHAAYPMLAGDTPANFSLSCKSMTPNEPDGSCMHGDYWEAWKFVTKKEWTDNCIDKLLSCQGGNLGDGFTLRGAAQPPYGWGTNPVPTVPLSAVPYGLGS